MKSKDLQNIVLSKYRKGNGLTKIFRDLAGGLSLETIKRWRKLIDTIVSIDLAYLSRRPCLVRTSGAIGKIKVPADASGRTSFIKLARKLRVSRTSVHRISKEDLNYRCYKKRIQSFLMDAHKT